MINENIKLHSYKINTNFLNSHLKQIDELKQQLETTLSNYKINEENYAYENEELKNEIKMLQRKLNQKEEHSGCRGVMRKLEEEIERKSEEIQKYRAMYELQKKNKAEIQRFYDNKLDSFQSDSKVLLDDYENQLNSLKVMIEHMKSQNGESVEDILSKGRTSRNFKSIYNIEHQINECQSESQQYFQNQPQQNHQKASTSTNLPHNNIQLQIKPFQTSKILQKNSQITIYNSQELFEKAIRKLYFEIKDVGVDFHNISILPQFNRFNNVNVVERKDLFNLIKMYEILYFRPPIEETNSKIIQYIVGYIERYVREQYKGQPMRGKHIINLFIKKLIQYSEAENIDLDEVEISGMTPMTRLGRLSHKIYKAEKKAPPSISDGLNIESDC